MSIFALVDCNNFYASCERVFAPHLEGQPIVVLSNNDGCIIARSSEAKKLKIPMGYPYFKIKLFLEKNNIKVFSSNYELYGDISARVMSTLETMCPEMEVYSIDEAFLQLDSFQHLNLTSYCLEMKKRVKQWTHIPVSIGIGPTKTLAKMANHVAKKQTADGVFNVCDKEIREKILNNFPVQDIWGIGRQLGKKLTALNIMTAQQLRDSNPKVLRKLFSVVMEKTILELNGVSCLDLADHQPRKQIMSSRSFGRYVVLKAELEQALAYHINIVAQRLRQQKSYASGVYIFFHTNPFKETKKQYVNATSQFFLQRTNDTGLILKTALACLNNIFKSGYEYHKIGVMLLDITTENILQQDLISQVSLEIPKSDDLMRVFDTINSKMGKGTIKYCIEGYKHAWALRADYRSLRATTCLLEIATVFCK